VESESTVALVARVAADALELPLPEDSLPPVVVEPPLVAVEAISLARRHTPIYKPGTKSTQPTQRRVGPGLLLHKTSSLSSSQFSVIITGKCSQNHLHLYL